MPWHHIHRVERINQRHEMERIEISAENKLLAIQEAKNLDPLFAYIRTYLDEGVRYYVFAK